MKILSIVNPGFWAAYSRLLKEDMPVKWGLALTRCLDKLQEEGKRADKLRNEIIEKFSLKDEEGKSKVTEDGMIDFETPEIEKECSGRLNDLMELEVDVVLPKLPVKVWENFSLKPFEADALKDFFEAEKE